MCPTKLLLPNPGADLRFYREQFHLKAACYSQARSLGARGRPPSCGRAWYAQMNRCAVVDAVRSVGVVQPARGEAGHVLREVQFMSKFGATSAFYMPTREAPRLAHRDNKAIARDGGCDPDDAACAAHNPGSKTRAKLGHLR